MPHKTTIKTNGQVLKVNASVSHWTTEALALTASGTNDVESSTTTTIYSDYDLWFANTATTATITVTQLDGTTLGTYTDLQVNPGVGTRVLSPVPDSRQLAADVVRGQSLRPAAALAETITRGNSPTFTNVSVLTSGRLFLQAISLPKDLLLTSATFCSQTTAANTPTNQWFALYDKDLALIRQTTDDTSTAWGATTAKTLSFSSTHTTTYAGLYYLGIMVAAATPPSLAGVATVFSWLALPPILNGNSTQSLTTTAPATAAAISGASFVPYAYVS